ncbi:MAG TPA: acyltransferase family protein, partial [Anaerolineales bacterium]|nr:acyltransferase family protein [Anaerolineales bacterium]
MPKRIEYIDIARGIGILLVVLAHNDFGFISQYGYQVIYSFHMPLFFLLSGYFIKTNISFFEFFKKRFHSLLKPFLFTLFLIYFLNVSFEKMAFETALRRIGKSLYGTGVYIDWVQLWFLPNLFVVSLYAFIFLVIVGKLNNRWL